MPWSAIYYVAYVCDVCEPLHVFSQSHTREWRESQSKYSPSKNRKIRERVYSSVQYGWKLRLKVYEQDVNTVTLESPPT